jgi:hypothetical protein
VGVSPCLPSSEAQHGYDQNLLLGRKVETPNERNGRGQDQKVEHGVGCIRADEKVFQVDTHGPGAQGIPRFLDRYALKHRSQSCSDTPRHGSRHQAVVVQPKPPVNTEDADVQTADTAFHWYNGKGIHYFDGVNVFEEQHHVVRVVLQHPEHVSTRAITGPEKVGCADDQEG